MDMHGYAYFVERPRRIEDLMVPHLIEQERPYRIVTEIQLPAIDYENFITDMLADRQFIKDHGRRCKRGEVWDCLLVRRKGKPDGVLVIPEAECFVGWAAYYCKHTASGRGSSARRLPDLKRACSRGTEKAADPKLPQGGNRSAAFA